MNEKNVKGRKSNTYTVLYCVCENFCDFILLRFRFRNTGKTILILQEKNHSGAVVQVPKQPTSSTGGRYRQGRQKKWGDQLVPTLQIISDPDANPLLKLVGYLPVPFILNRVQQAFPN